MILKLRIYNYKKHRLRWLCLDSCQINHYTKVINAVAFNQVNTVVENLKYSLTGMSKQYNKTLKFKHGTYRDTQIFLYHNYPYTGNSVTI